MKTHLFVEMPLFGLTSEIIEWLVMSKKNIIFTRQGLSYQQMVKDKKKIVIFKTIIFSFLINTNIKTNTSLNSGVSSCLSHIVICTIKKYLLHVILLRSKLVFHSVWGSTKTRVYELLLIKANILVYCFPHLSWPVLA